MSPSITGTTDETALLRRLGSVERYFASRHHLGIYRAVVVTARHVGSGLTTTTTGSDDSHSLLPSSRFLTALSAIVVAHPMLRVGIVDEGTNNTRFVHLQTVDLHQHVSTMELESCATDQLLNARLASMQALEHDQLWEKLDAKPPWRVKLVRNRSPRHKKGSGDACECCSEDVIFSFHHSIADGKSGMLFHSLMLDALAAVAVLKTTTQGTDSSSTTLLSFPERPALPLAQEDSVAFSYSPSFIAAMAWDQLAPSMFKAAPQPVWGAKAIDFAAPFVTRLLTIDLSADRVQPLLAASRAHQTTMTGLLHSLTFVSLVSVLATDDDSKEGETLKSAPAFSCGTPISLTQHQREQQQEETLQLRLCTMDHKISPAEVAAMRSAVVSGRREAVDAEMWKAAQRIRGELAAKVESLPRDSTAAMLQYVGDFAKYWTAKNGKQRRNSWECSNVGQLQSRAEADADGKRGRVTRVVFSNGAPVTGAALGINVASVKGKGLTIALSFQDGIVENDVAESVKLIMERTLLRIAEEEGI